MRSPTPIAPGRVVIFTPPGTASRSRPAIIIEDSNAAPGKAYQNDECQLAVFVNGPNDPPTTQSWHDAVPYDDAGRANTWRWPSVPPPKPPAPPAPPTDEQVEALYERLLVIAARRDAADQRLMVEQAMAAVKPAPAPAVADSRDGQTAVGIQGGAGGQPAADATLAAEFPAGLQRDRTSSDTVNVADDGHAVTVGD